jgi:hypothetical protein
MSHDYDLWNICYLLMVWTFLVPLLWGILGQIFYGDHKDDDDPWEDDWGKDCNCRDWDVDDDDWDDDDDDDDDGEAWKRGKVTT